jgi:hypothetical protein
MKINHLAICITVHYSPDRIKYLETMGDHFSSLANKVDVFVITNADSDKGEIQALDNALRNKNFKYEFFVPHGLGHPYLLAWSHFSVFRKLVSDESITHFMYLEDDLLITKENIDYWIESLGDLMPHGLIPSFFRVEKNYANSRWYSSDAQEQFYFSKLPKVSRDSSYVYINLPPCYQGMYLLPREFMIEHLNGKSSSPDFGIWYIREKAAQGLTFHNVPSGFTSRNLVGFDLDRQRIDPRSFIHHLPNNYANRIPPDGRLGTIQVNDVILMGRKKLKIKKYLTKINNFLRLK